MITADFTGNLGNHLWQYAITRAVAEHNGYEWGFNRTTSHDYYGGKPQMDFMEIDYGKEHTTPWGQLPPGITKVWEEPKEAYDGYNYHPFTSSIFEIEDNTKLIIHCCQNARYLQNRKEDVRNWFKPKDKSVPLDLNDNLCIINVRGGEYKGIPSLLLDPNYFFNAVEHMIHKNNEMKFVVITDDMEYARSILPFPVYHFSIAEDYKIIGQTKNLILSNSSFALFPAWLNDNAYIIAPKYWARHNVSTGYWANSDIWTFGFHFLDRKGILE